MRIPETESGEFLAGNPATGKPGSILTSALMNSWLRELLGVLFQAGITADPDDNEQLAKAIIKIVGDRTKAATEQVAGLIRLATTAQAQGLADDTAALTPKKLLDVFKVGQVLGHLTNSQKLPGGLILKTGVFYQNTPSSANFATPFPNACAAVVGAESAVPVGNPGFIVVQFSNITATGFNAQMRDMTGMFPNAATVRYIAIGF